MPVRRYGFSKFKNPLRRGSHAILKIQICVIKGEVQWNNNAIWKVRGDNTNEHGIIVFINSSIDMKNISFKVFSYTLCL